MPEQETLEELARALKKFGQGLLLNETAQVRV
jgi:hypothetical protein